MKVLFPQVCHRLQVPFYRTKVTSWMASQEEDYRFILLEADPAEDRGWAQLCVEQACPRPAVLVCSASRVPTPHGSDMCDSLP